MCDPTCSVNDIANTDYQKQFQFQWGEEVLENETILKLINLKEKYSRTYNDDECWLKISEELNVHDESECKSMYHKLLTKYKLLKKQPIGAQDKSNQWQLYPFFEMIFPLVESESDINYLFTNFASICRFCLKMKSDSLTVAEIYDDSTEESIQKSNDLIRKIRFTVYDNINTIEIGEYKLSNLICEPCNQKIDTFFYFKRQCEINSNLLMKVKEELETRTHIKSEMLEMSMDEQPNEMNSTTNHSLTELENENENEEIGNISEFAFSEDENDESEETEEDEEKQTDDPKPSKPKIIKDKSDNAKTSKTKKQYKGKLHQCSICGKMCKGIQMHMLTHTGEKKYKCQYCPKTFTQSGQLKRHINSHLNIRNYKCLLCDKTFVDPSSVTKHMVVHNREDRKFVCTLCGSRFNRLGALRYHEKTHRQERNHECDVCKKAFLAKYDLTKHYRIHTGEKPYKCTYCDKRFTISKNAKVHMRVHTKEKPYNCSLCELSFSYRSSLKNHLLKIHNHTDVPNLPLLQAINIAIRETNTNTSVNANSTDPQMQMIQLASTLNSSLGNMEMALPINHQLHLSSAELHQMTSNNMENLN